jgi:hypothetical protein
MKTEHEITTWHTIVSSYSDRNQERYLQQCHWEAYRFIVSWARHWQSWRNSEASFHRSQKGSPWGCCLSVLIFLCFLTCLYLLATTLDIIQHIPVRVHEQNLWRKHVASVSRPFPVQFMWKYYRLTGPKKSSPMHVAPACVWYREESDHFWSYVRSISLHFISI